MDPVDSRDDLRKQRDSLLEIVYDLKRRIWHLRDLLERVYRNPDDAKKLIRPELDTWEEP